MINNFQQLDFHGKSGTWITSYAMKSIPRSGKVVHLLHSNVTVSCTDFDWQIPHTLEVAYELLVTVGHI